MLIALYETSTPFEFRMLDEHLARTRANAAALIPNNSAEALEARLLDRVFDNYVMAPMQKIVADLMRRQGLNRVAQARTTLDNAYGWIRRGFGRAWLAGDAFTLADCAAAPSLFYSDWVHPIPARLARLREHRAKLLAHASVVHDVDEARPYRRFFRPARPIGTERAVRVHPDRSDLQIAI